MNPATHIPPPLLAPTIAPLGDDVRRILDRLHEMGIRHVQLNAAAPGMRPRELDQSARRDLLATMRRREIEPAGIDLWIPVEHFCDAATVDRAAGAVHAAIEMAADIGRVPLSVALPLPESHGEEKDPAVPEEVVATLIAAADRQGVALTDHTVFKGPKPPRDGGEFFGVGIDPPAWLTAAEDPAQVVRACGGSLISARLADLTPSGTRAPLGTRGRLDVVAYQVALSVAGYRRPVVLDARQWNDPWNGLERSKALWHGV